MEHRDDIVELRWDWLRWLPLAFQWLLLPLQKLVTGGVVATAEALVASSLAVVAALAGFSREEAMAAAAVMVATTREASVAIVTVVDAMVASCGDNHVADTGCGCGSNGSYSEEHGTSIRT